MKAQWRFSGCNGADRRRFLQAWQELEGWLSGQIEEAEATDAEVAFAIRYDRGSPHPWRVRGWVQFSMQTCYVKMELPDPMLALQKCISRLADQIADVGDLFALADRICGNFPRHAARPTPFASGVSRRILPSIEALRLPARDRSQRNRRITGAIGLSSAR